MFTEQNLLFSIFKIPEYVRKKDQTMFLQIYHYHGEWNFLSNEVACSWTNKLCLWLYMKMQFCVDSDILS